MERIH